RPRSRKKSSKKKSKSKRKRRSSKRAKPNRKPKPKKGKKPSNRAVAGRRLGARRLGAERVGVDQLGGAPGLLPPEEVPDALEDLQLGAGDQRGDQLAVGDRDHPVLGTVDDQGRRGDLGEPGLDVVAADR